MTVGALKFENRLRESCERLLFKAANNRGLTVDDVLPRVRAIVEKTFRCALDAIDSKQAADLVDVLHIDDLCLVIKCERGDDAAWQELFTNFGSTVRAAARKIAANNEDAEDLANSIWAELHGLRLKSNGQPAGKLGYYSGRGSLAGWLRAVTAQLAIDAHRKTARMVQIEETREFENLAHEADVKETAKFQRVEDNPEKFLTEKRVKQTVESALLKATGELDHEDRLLLKLYYFDNLNLKQAGAILGFHEATASRRVVRIQTTLRKRIEQILRDENRWQVDEIKRVLADAASFLQTDVEKLVRDN